MKPHGSNPRAVRAARARHQVLERAERIEAKRARRHEQEPITNFRREPVDPVDLADVPPTQRPAPLDTTLCDAYRRVKRQWCVKPVRWELQCVESFAGTDEGTRKNSGRPFRKCTEHSLPYRLAGETEGTCRVSFTWPDFWSTFAFRRLTPAELAL